MTSRSIRSHFTAGLKIRPAVFWVVAAFAGCAPNLPEDIPGPFQPVSGSIKLDGKPLQYVHVTFVPVREGAVIASGETDADGRYRLAYLNRPGTSVGDYRVVLSYRTTPEGTPISELMDSSLLVPREVSQAYERLPETYSSEKSVLKARVESGPNVIDFHLKGPLVAFGNGGT